MKSRHVFILIVFLAVFDLISINVGLSTVNLAGWLTGLNLYGAIQVWAVINFSWLLSAVINRVYTQRNVQSREVMYSKSIITFITQVFLAGLLFLIFPKYFQFDIAIFYALVFGFAGITVVRFTTGIFERYYLEMDNYKKKVAILGSGEMGLKLERFFLDHKLSVKLAGPFPEAEAEYQEVDHLNGSALGQDIRYAIEHHLDEVYTTHFPGENQMVDELVEFAERHCVRVKFVSPEVLSSSKSFMQNNQNFVLNGLYDGIPILVNRPEPLYALSNRIIKRLFDIVFSLFVIVFILSWFLPIMAFLIRMESKGPVFFRQPRSGRDNKTFLCYKFRSMQVNTNSHSQQAIKNDPRVTKIGAFMRKTSIDELPQFINVLMGNMSVVGPRPHMVKHTEQYSAIIESYMLRHLLKPGITGWAQVSGFRGETREKGQMEGRVQHDIWYMENWSLLLDFQIVYKTVINAVKGEENAF